MITESYICPRCSLEVSLSGQLINASICPHCSWDRLHNEITYEKNIAKRSVYGSAALFVFILIAIVQAANWGHHFFSAVPLQARHWLGIAGESDYQSLAKMCTSLNDAGCVVKMLTEKAKANPKRASNFAELGIVQFEREEFQSAAQNLERYLKLGGKDLYAQYTYARALAAAGEISKATAHFERILAIKPNVIQVTITEAYFDMLVKNGKKEKAVALIRGIQRKGENTGSFMEPQLRKLVESRN